MPPGLIERGVAWLSAYQAKQIQLLDNAESKVQPSKPAADDLDAMVFMVLADAGSRNDRMLADLDRDRTKLSVYGKALFGLGLERIGDKEKLAGVLRNIRQYVVRDDENQTAYLKLPNQGYSWWWYGSEIETHAFYLELLARTDPKGELAPRLVKYVLNNRSHGTYWNSTRDTAFCVEAMADYLKASGEDRPDMTVAIAIDGQARKEVKITPADLFSFDNGFALDGAVVDDRRAHGHAHPPGQGPGVLQRLPDQLHDGGPDHPRGAGDQGRSQDLPAREGRQVDRCHRRPRPGDRPAGRALPPRADGRRRDLQERRPGRGRAGDRQQERLRVPGLRGLQGGRLRAGRGPQRVQRQRPGRLRRVPRRARGVLRPDAGAGQAQRLLSPPRRDPRPVPRPARPRQAMYAPELRANSDEIRLRVED